MLFRTHLVFGVFVYFVLSYFVEMPLFVLVFVLLATVFVDIDVRNSRFGNRWYFRPVQFFLKHRGVLHSLFFGGLLSLMLGGVDLWAGFGFFVGYVSHLFLDCWTRSGVALFWPFGWRVKGFVRSGGIIEDVVFVLLLLVDIGLGILYYINAY
jgi:inner membrane protein